MAPIQVPYTIESVAVVVPAREWRVSTEANGLITADLLDRQSGLLMNSIQLNFERGDQVHIRYHLDDTHPGFVAEGEKVITVESAELEQRIIQLASQLLVEEQNKRALITGQKRELIKQLQAEVELARENLSLQQKNFERIKGLYEGKVVALAEFEIAQTAFNEAQANVGIAEKAVEVARTGEKAETIAVANARINALKSELEFLRRKKQDYELVCPLSGSASYLTDAQGTAFVVRDTAQLTLQIPVRMRDRQFLVPGQPVWVKIRETGQQVRATLTTIETEPRLLGGQAAVIVNTVPAKGQHLPQGQFPLRCELRLGKVTIKEFLRRAIRWQ